MRQDTTEDWIDHIINRTYENYNGRKIVLWGKYGVSDTIKDRLKEKYGIDTEFYVDSDTAKIDDKQVFMPDCLLEKSDKYYVVIPIAFYTAVKETITRGGIKAD